MIKYITIYVSLFLVFILSVSCGAFIIRQAQFFPHEDYKHDLYDKKPAARDIELFLSVQDIKRRYKELGIIESRQLGDGWTLIEKKESAERKLISSVKKRALEIGADALIRLEASCNTSLSTFRFSSGPSEEVEGIPTDFNRTKDEQYKQVRISARYLAIAWAE